MANTATTSEKVHARSTAQQRRNRRPGRETTRTCLLDAAERLWAERGIHGVSLDDVAAAAGLTKGAVYSNYTGKTDLMLAVLDRYTRTNLEMRPLLHDPVHASGTDSPVGERKRRGNETCPRQPAGQPASSDSRQLVLLLVEFWLHGMRDYTAARRIADWFHTRRENLAAEFRRPRAPASGATGKPAGMPASERAVLAMAMDFGLALQHLLDPDRVPARVYGEGMRLVLGPALPPR